MEEADFPYRCSICNEEFVGAAGFRHHLRLYHHAPFSCGQNDCERIFEHQTSLMRHIKDVHFDEQEGIVEGNVSEEEERNDEGVREDYDDDEVLDGNESQSTIATSEPDGEPLDLTKAAAFMILHLRRSAGLTSAQIARIQDSCFMMIQNVVLKHQQIVREAFQNLNIDNDIAENVLMQLQVENPFVHLRTQQQQLSYFAKEFGLVASVPHFLGNRTEFKLNPITNQYEPTQVAKTFEYVSLIGTLKLVLSNRKLKFLIENEKKSDDGILRSYLDGTRARSNTLIQEYPHTIRIQAYVDDLELTNPLGSRTIVHKLTSFYFSIQNLPPVESSQLSMIYLVALAYAEDMKMPNAYSKFFYPFLQDLKKLERPEGVVVTINNEPVCIRATLCVLSADTLAAHEVLGYLGPGARCFCRKCGITRVEFRADCKVRGEMRTKESFDTHVQMLKDGLITPTACGIKEACALHKAEFFSAPDDSPFDIFHDLLEGVCHVVILLALRYFIVTKKYFSLDDFNERLASFNYGIPDKCNKPSPNFTQKRLDKNHFLQKGSQTWCLMRAIGFLIPEVPDDDPYLRLINLLQQCMLIIFALENRPEDVHRLEELIDQFFNLFQQLHIGPVDLGEEEEEEEEQEEEEVEVQGQPNADEIALGVSQVVKEVSPINKLHHLGHYPQMIKELGPLSRFNCIRYEAKHQGLKQYASVCCNFINLPKTMAQMHQMNTLADVLKPTFRANDMEVHSGQYTTVGNSDHSELFAQLGLDEADVVSDVNAVVLVGEDFRRGLFILLDAQGPSFGLIERVYSHEELNIYFAVVPWKTVKFSERYCAYHVEPNEGQTILVKHKQLKHYQAFAPWNPWRERTIYVSPRTIIL